VVLFGVAGGIEEKDGSRESTRKGEIMVNLLFKYEFY